MAIPRPPKPPLFKYPCTYSGTYCDECRNLIRKEEILFRDYYLENSETLCEDCGNERAVEQERKIVERMATDEEM